MLIICGPSCIGKDTLVKELARYGWWKLKSYTTRPKREGETDEDYIFTGDPEWGVFQKYDKFFEETAYVQSDGSIWRYGTTEEQWETMKSNPKSVAILNPEGIKMVERNAMPYDLLYLTTDNSVAMDKELERRYFARGGSKENWFDRSLKDIEDFANFNNDLEMDKYHPQNFYKFSFDTSIKVETIASLAAILDAVGIETLCKAKEWNSKHNDYNVEIFVSK